MEKSIANRNLTTAIHNGDPDGVLRSLEDGANANGRIGNETTILLWCIERAQSKMIECLDHLLAHGADPNQCDDSQISPLMKACWGGQIDAVFRLIEAGANVNHQNEDGLTVVMSVTGNRLASVANLELLLAAGADLEAMDKKGATAWHVFARKGSRPLLDRLLAAGANPAHRNTAGEHAWEVLFDPSQDPSLEGWLESQAQSWILAQGTRGVDAKTTIPRL